MVESRILENGLKVVVKRMEGLLSVTMGILTYFSFAAIIFYALSFHLPIFFSIFCKNKQNMY